MRPKPEDVGDMQGVLESMATHANKPVVSHREGKYWGKTRTGIATIEDDWEKDVLISAGWRILELEVPRVIIALPPGY
jgi:hypothetical protein